MSELRVHVDIGGSVVFAGIAYFTLGRGGVSTTFVYDPAYISDPRGYDIEPRLVRQSGQQFVDGLPGSFGDCAPDRWGRNLIDRRRRVAQTQSQRRPPGLTDVDYLTGASDVTRQGNLHFSEGEGPYLDPDEHIPTVVSLPGLLASSDTLATSAGADDLAAV